MTVTQHIITIAVVVLGTMITRFLPFLVFPSESKTPKYIKYLGKALPPAIFGFLVVFCLKDVSFTSGAFGIPELACMLIVALLYAWKRNMFLSMFGGTACYMILAQFIL